jgi:hypothetical protein
MIVSFLYTGKNIIELNKFLGIERLECRINEDEPFVYYDVAQHKDVTVKPGELIHKWINEDEAS